MTVSEYRVWVVAVAAEGNVPIVAGAIAEARAEHGQGIVGVLIDELRAAGFVNIAGRLDPTTGEVTP